jgi:hypothetical protein
MSHASCYHHQFTVDDLRKGESRLALSTDTTSNLVRSENAVDEVFCGEMPERFDALAEN